MNITDVLSEHAEMRPDHPAIEDANRVVTYAELNALVDAAAANMQSEGIGAGDVIGISLPDCVDYLITLLGLARAGAVMFAIDRRLPASEQRKAAEQAKVRTVIATDNAGRIGSVRLLPVGLICRPAASAFKRPSLDADHPLMIVQSSGTTGAPKTFLWGHARMWVQVPRHRKCFDLTWQDRYLAVVRMSFFWEQEICMVMFGLGATIVVNHARSVRELVINVSDHQITMLALTPSHLSKLLDYPSLQKPLFPTVRAMVVGSAPLAHERRLLVRDQLTPNFYEQLGTNEAGLMILGTPFNQDKHPDAIGRVVDGVEAQVIGADGRALPQGEVGLLGFRGEGFPTEYVGNPEATRRAFRKGWFYPGDLAAIDGDGYVFFKGRADDVINNAGAKFYPIEVEKVLLSHPAVAEAAVFGWPHRQNGEVSVACVVAKGGITALELGQFCLHYIATWKVPHRFLFMKTLPRNAAGKILKLRLRKNFADAFDNQPF